MNDKDLRLYANTRLQLARGLQGAESVTGNPALAMRLREQLASHPYNLPAVIAESERLMRPRQPAPDQPTVLDFVRGRAVRSSNPQGG